MLATQSASEMSRPICVSLTETLTSAPLRGHPIEHPEVLVARRHRLGLGGDALAQQVERRGDAAPAQLPGRLHALIDRFARHEPRREPPGQTVAADEVEDALPLGEPEQALSHDHVSHLVGNWNRRPMTAAKRPRS